MKPTLLLSAFAFLALPVALSAEDAKPETASTEAASPAADLKAAVAKLADASGYTWKTTTVLPESGQGQGGRGRWRPGPSEGKITKEGFAVLKQTFGDNTSESVIKGEKYAVKTPDGWKTGEELREQRRAGGDGEGRRGRGPGGGFGSIARNFKAPAAQAGDLVGQVKELKKDGDTFKGALTSEAAKSLLSFGGGQRRDGGGGEGPQIDDPRGSVTFWLKDGALAKYELKLAGSITFRDNTRDVDRTTTTEITEVGSTTVEIADDVKKKLE